MEKMKWKDYEVFIHKHFSQAFPEAKISHNVKIPGLISKKKRQIDILIEQSVAGFPIKIVADCKCFKKNIDPTFPGFHVHPRLFPGLSP